MKQRLILPVGLIFLLAMGLILTCSDDCPTCPKLAIPGNYFVYMINDRQSAPDHIWIINSATDSLEDSIYTPDKNITTMDVSLNGQYLAARASAADTVYVFDVVAKTIISRLAPAGIPLFTHNNTQLVISDIRSQRLMKFDILSASLTAEDSMLFSALGLFNMSACIYGFNNNDDSSWYYIYDYEMMSVVKRSAISRPDHSFFTIMKITLSPDDEYFYMIVRPDKIFKYDIAHDSIIDSLYIYYGAYFGDLKCTADGKHLLVTEACNPTSAQIPGSVAIIDLEAFAITRRIVSWGLDPTYPQFPIQTGNIVITPDGFKAYTGPTGFNGGVPISLNLLDFTACRLKGLPLDNHVGIFAMGRKIK
jgi:hypothetical protein